MVKIGQDLDGLRTKNLNSEVGILCVTQNNFQTEEDLKHNSLQSKKKPKKEI